MSEKSEIPISPLRSFSTSQQPLVPASPSPFVRLFSRIAAAIIQNSYLKNGG